MHECGQFRRPSREAYRSCHCAELTVLVKAGPTVDVIPPSVPFLSFRGVFDARNLKPNVCAPNHRRQIPSVELRGMTFTSVSAGPAAINRLFDKMPDLAGILSMLRLRLIQGLKQMPLRAEAIEIANEARKRDEGWQSQETSAMAVTGSGPVGEGRGRLVGGACE